jgi:hypothetical protein
MGRYVLYVTSKAEADALLKRTTIKSTCNVQLLTKLSAASIPQWFAQCESPMLADTQDEVMYYGTAVATFLKSKTSAAFGVVDSIDEM